MRLHYVLDECLDKVDDVLVGASGTHRLVHEQTHLLLGYGRSREEERVQLALELVRSLHAHRVTAAAYLVVVSARRGWRGDHMKRRHLFMLSLSLSLSLSVCLFFSCLVTRFDCLSIYVCVYLYYSRISLLLPRRDRRNLTNTHTKKKLNDRRFDVEKHCHRVLQQQMQMQERQTQRLFCDCSFVLV